MGARCGVGSSWVSHMEWIVLDAEEGNFARSGAFECAVMFPLPCTNLTDVEKEGKRARLQIAGRLVRGY